MRAACLTLAALALLAPAPALASGFSLEGEYIMAGVDLGLTLDDDLGALLGVEISYVELEDAGPWVGIVTGAVWASDPDVIRFVLGAEAGNGFAGIEAGATLDTAGTFGGRFRIIGTLGIASIYLGLGLDGAIRGEFGVLLKVPGEL